ncbi:hypothetical protein C8R45DRAFT_1183723 [Mycena sanguinolenta]|nr:hypothetical protein C8R45DRAFT_1183723 [Mycena sanguinolenta]
MSSKGRKRLVGFSSLVTLPEDDQIVIAADSFCPRAKKKNTQRTNERKRIRRGVGTHTTARQGGTLGGRRETQGRSRQSRRASAAITIAWKIPMRKKFKEGRHNPRRHRAVHPLFENRRKLCAGLEAGEDSEEAPGAGDNAAVPLGGADDHMRASVPSAEG